MICESIFGHRYEARYEEVPTPLAEGGFRVKQIAPDKLRGLLLRKVYVRDVCRRCGHTIERE